MTVRLLFAIAAGVALLSAAETPAQSLLILSKADRTLSIVDPSTLQVIAKMPSGPDPHEVIASSDGRFAYISNYGGGAYHTITPVDLVAQKSLPEIDLGALSGPHGLDYQGGKVWFTAEAAMAIGSYDPAARKIDWIMGTGQGRTHMIWVAPDLKRIITSNITGATISIFDPVRRPIRPGPTPPRRGPVEWSQTVIPVGAGVEGFDISPSGKELWGANAQDGTISIIDLSTNRVILTMDGGVRGANRLKFTPDGTRVLISTLGGNELSVFDVAARKLVKRIETGRAAGIQMDPSGARVFVACTPTDHVDVIDLKTLEITTQVDAGKQPDGMAWAIRQ